MTQRTNRKRFTEEQMKLEKIINDLGLQTILEYPIDRFYTDIFCPELGENGVCVEYNGPTHKMTKKKDKERSSIIQAMYGYSIIEVSDLSPQSIENFKKELLSYC